MDLLAELQGCSHQDQPGADPLGPHALAEPVARDVDEILGVEVINRLLGLEVVQHILDADGDIRVARVVEGRQQHGGVLVHLQHVVEGLPPLLQLVESEGEREGV